MARWKFLFNVALILLAFFLASGNFTYFPGDVYWQSDDAGFLSGAIHGILAPISLFAGIFKGWNMYELNNSGFFYNLGFLIGLLFVWGGSGKSTNHIIKNYYHAPKSNVENRRFNLLKVFKKNNNEKTTSLKKKETTKNNKKSSKK